MPLPDNIHDMLCVDKHGSESTVFHDEFRIRELCAHYGVSIVESTFGYWSGRKDLVRSLQDVIIAIEGQIQTQL